MESWINTIIEWINCLGVCEKPISNIQQLQDHTIFYSKLIKILRKINREKNSDDCVEVFKFIEDEYPEITINKNENIDSETEQVYMASLLLLSASQNASFHRPMYTLKNETQLLIKQFLELILPYGRDITLDTIRDTILELDDKTPLTPPQTPKDRLLKNFLTSPAAQSAYRNRIMNERTRELRLLKAQLETERFEKADLQEDIQMLEDKVNNLQKKLQNKTDELKVLRTERTNAATPKSARKTKRNEDAEGFLRKEVQHLETFNAKLQGDLDRLESDNENLTRRLMSKERVSNTLKEKVDEYEREMETLNSQLELKTNELLDLRMQNEELRAHIKGIQKYSIDVEQSFEVEHISRARSPTPGLNDIEAASSIIDIQLRESYEESAKLRTELNSLQEKLDAALKECEELKLNNEILNGKVTILDEVQMTLEITEDKLSKRDCQLHIVEMEKKSLQDELKKLQDLIDEKEILLRNTETKKSEFEAEISNLKEELNNIKISLVTTEDSLAQISTLKEVLYMKLISSEEKINVLDKSLANKTAECVELTKISQDKICELEENIIVSSKEKQKLEENLVQKDKELEDISTELAGKNSEINLLKSNLSRLENQLNLDQLELSETKMKLCELNELQDELQSQLVQEREKAAAIFNKKCELECNLQTMEETKNNISDQFTAVQLNLNELLQKHDDLRDKLKLEGEKYLSEKKKAGIYYSEKENLAVELANVNAEISQLKNIQENLENRFRQEQECCMKLVTEKADLECTIATNQRKNIEQSEKISTLQTQLDKSHVELEQITAKYNDCSVNCAKASEQIENLSSTIAKSNSEVNELNKKISELEENEIFLKNELTTAQDSYETLSAENIAMEIAISSRDKEKKKSMAEMSVLQSDLNTARKDVETLKNNYEELQEKYEDATRKIASLSEQIEIRDTNCKEITCKRNSLQSRVNKVTEELNSRETECKEMRLQINELRQIKERMMDIHQNHQDASTELIESLEKRLQATQNTCESLKLDAKLQQESFENLKSKLEIVTNEKIESELKFNKIIDNLQEVRSNQESVMEAQAKALADKISELNIFEQQHLKMKEELQSEIDLQRAHNEESLNQCKTLKELMDKNDRVIQELEQIRDQENNRSKKLREEYELLDANMKIIEETCEKLSENCQQDNNVDLNVLFNYPATEKLGEKLKNIANKIKITHEKVLQLQEENNNLKKNLEDNKETIEIVATKEKDNAELLNRVNSMETEWTKRYTFLTNLIKKKENMQALLKETITSQDVLENKLLQLRESWNSTSFEVKQNIAVNSSACDELKHIEALRMDIEKSLNDLDDRCSKNSKPLMKILCRLFMLSEKKLDEVYGIPLTKAKEDTDEIDLTDELSVLQTDIERNEAMLKDVIKIQIKIDELREVSNSYTVNIKSGIIKREVVGEEKLQIQLERLMKEKKELKDKMESTRVRNAKLEKNMDELRNENKKMKAELSEISSKDKSELDQLTAQNEQLLKDIESLKEEKLELEKRPKQEDFEIKLKDVHNEYGQKLEKLKLKMKTAYNAEIDKVNAEQEKAMTEKVALMRTKMEQQCKKYSEDIAKYKAHISDMSSQFWDVGEKLLAEKQEKEIAINHLRELQKKHQTAMAEANQSIQSSLSHNQVNSMNIGRDYNYDRGDMPTRSSFRTVQLIEEQTTTTRRHSVKSIQAMGNAFNAADEEGEVFDNVYLADLKEGKFRGIDPTPDFDRMSELRMRNSLCRPHLKSSYAVETHFHPLALTEEDIKSGPPHEDTFNDSLSQSLLPGQKPKKKDRTQTSYKRPGPPTPSKNGGRLSLQGNELKSPSLKILRERNSERRTTATPKRLKDFFASSLSRRQDENAPATPKGRRISNIFRKTRTDKI